jgi:hypothetical protein
VKRTISLVLVPEIAAAAILAGCGADHRVAQRCVDERQVVVPDEQCEEQSRRIASGTASTGHYYWYHGGRGTSIGSSASGGTAVLAHPSVPRGGFGSTGSMHSFSGGS